MAELLWRGKRKGRPRPRRPARSLRLEEVHGAAPEGAWRNRLVLGDADDVLPSLLSDLAGQVALVYVDPPFDTGGDFDFRATIPGAPDETPRIVVPAYRDARGLDAWLAWFHGVAENLRDLLAPGGSLYVHLDAHVAHYAKVLLDEVFGPGAFQREIVWRIGWVSGFKSRARNWIRNHDVILFYAKGGRGFTFHKEYVPYPPGYVRRDGAPPKGQGYPMEDVWNASELDRMDSIQIMSFSGEKVGYPTQKNESLVARIVRAASRPGDLVLDAFVGSGTTAAVADKLGRRWVACDASPIAVHTTRKRLLALREPAPFAVERVEPSRKAPHAAHAPPLARPRPPAGRKLTARASVDGRRCTIELASFALPARAVPADARAGVEHWSQWLEGWCVDWDHRGGALHAGARAWRTRARAPLPLTATHAYDRPGRYVALVKAFDVLGGATTRELRVEVR